MSMPDVERFIEKTNPFNLLKLMSKEVLESLLNGFCHKLGSGGINRRICSSGVVQTRYSVYPAFRNMGIDIVTWLQNGLIDILIPGGDFQLNEWEYSGY
jgi:hypothetical protein